MDNNEKHERANSLDNELRLRMVMESASVGTWDYSPVSEEMNWSAECRELFGAAPQQHISYPLFINQVHSEDRGLVEAEMQRLMSLSADDVYNACYRIIRFDDASVRWLKVRGRMLFNASQQAGLFIGIVIDITDQKNKEVELEEKVAYRTHELSLKNHEMEVVQEIAEMGSWEWNVEAGTLTWSANMYRIFRSDPEEGITYEKFLSFLHPDDLERITSCHHHTQQRFVDYRYRIITPDNVMKTIYSRAEITVDPLSGKPGKINGMCRDISSEIEMNYILEQKNYDLERSNAELASFAYIASHDLQEPLRKIKMFTGKIFATDANVLSDAGKDCFDRILSATGRMQELIMSLLNYNGLNPCKRQFETTDLNAVLNDVKHELSEVIHEKKAVIRSAELPVINVIHCQFRQLLVNLIDNAIKYSRKDIDPTVTITAELLKDHFVSRSSTRCNYWKINFSDNGIGFDPRFNEKIFGLFKRLHNHGNYPGTGAGLAVCKKIVENHNGMITAFGAVNQGATFSILIPV